jgi:hypothetical protein
VVLTGARATSDGEMQVRVTYTSAGEGRATQLWEISRDGGTTWEPELEVQLVRAPD